MDAGQTSDESRRITGLFVKGQSGNPGGRPRKSEALKLAEKLSKAQAQAVVEQLMGKALTALDQSLRSRDEQIRLRAALSVLDRSLGLPTQRIDATITSNETTTVVTPEMLRQAALRVLAAQATDVELADADPG